MTSSGSRPHLSRGASGASGAPHGMQWSCAQMEVDVGKLAEVIVPITPKGSEHEDKDVASSVAVCSARERRDAASSLSAVLLASGIIKRTKRQWNPKKLHWEARVVLPSVKVAVPILPEPLAGEGGASSHAAPPSL